MSHVFNPFIYLNILVRHTCLIDVNPIVLLSDILGSLIHCLFLAADSYSYWGDCGL